MHAGQPVCVDQVGHGAVYHHLLEFLLRIRLLRGNEACAHIDKVGAQNFSCAYLAAVIDTAAQHQATVPEFAYLANQRERALVRGMTTRASAYTDKSIHTRVNRLAGMRCTGHVAEHRSAIGVHSLDHLAGMAQAGNDKGHAMFDDKRQVGLKTDIGTVNDEVDTVGGHNGGRVGGTVCGQAGFNVCQPLVELPRRACIDMREGTDNARLALGGDQRRKGHQKHGRANSGYGQRILENFG
ncbi:hypothetical protein D9M73_33860 [compost metagenome]